MIDVIVYYAFMVLVVLTLIGMYYISFLVWSIGKAAKSDKVFVPSLEDDQKPTPYMNKLYYAHHHRIELIHDSDASPTVYSYKSMPWVNLVPLTNINAILLVFVVIMSQVIGIAHVTVLLGFIPTLVILKALKGINMFGMETNEKKYVASLENLKEKI